MKISYELLVAAEILLGKQVLLMLFLQIDLWCSHFRDVKAEEVGE
jgi:hypothetical protein